jgi:D-3-phosphoglycerate dehydrogenase
VVEGAPNLKFLNVAFTGIDHVGLETCKAKGVTVCNAAGYSTQCVAELALGLAIAALRFIPACDITTRAGGTSVGLRGREIFGKTVGIVGTGAIGTQTARLFLAFGAKVIAYSRTKRPDVEALGVEYRSLEEVVAQSDILSIHTPNNAETKGLISAELIAAMKPTAVLVNVARGAIVDNAALAKALNEGTIAGAGIDVFDMEPPIPENYPLLYAKNTVLTPHVAFATEESMLRRAEIVFRNVDAWLEGKPENVCKL